MTALSAHLSPYLNLEHIRGSDLARRDVVAVRNLLDVFSVLFHMPLPSLSSLTCAAVGGSGERVKGGQRVVEEKDGDWGDADDSNLISSEGETSNLKL